MGAGMFADLSACKTRGVECSIIRAGLIRARLMVGLQTLTLPIEVRILGPEPRGPIV